MLVKFIIIDESILISGRTIYPCPGFTTVMLSTESRLITASSTASSVGAGYSSKSTYAVTLGGSVYPFPPSNTTTSGKSINILSPGKCTSTGVPFNPRLNPETKFSALSTEE